jgi:hypothetical protein
VIVSVLTIVLFAQAAPAPQTQAQPPQAVKPPVTQPAAAPAASAPAPANAQPPAPVGPQGLQPNWELKPHAEKLGKDIARLRPLYERLNPGEWLANGAAPAYQKQWTDFLNQVGYVQNVSSRLAAQPDRLSIAVETMVRLETLMQNGTSIAQAVRRYQNPAIAEVLEGELSAAGAEREWLRKLVSDLSSTREQELDAAEREAQRCRTQIMKPGATRK